MVGEEELIKRKAFDSTLSNKTLCVETLIASRMGRNKGFAPLLKLNNQIIIVGGVRKEVDCTEKFSYRVTYVGNSEYSRVWT